MKTKQIFLFVLSMLMTSCVISRSVDTYVGPEVYQSIPLAPDIVLVAETPAYKSPGTNFIWIDGYWSWDNRYREYVWVQGRWEQVPYHGAFWIPGYWDYNNHGYRWIDACWVARDHHISYGYYPGRYDYYGRPVYYHRPGAGFESGFAYGYDHRQSSRSKGYSSSRNFNDAPIEKRKQETREFYRTSQTSRRDAATNRTSQSDIRIREGNSSRSSATSPSGTSRSSSPSATSPSATSRSSSPSATPPSATSRSSSPPATSPSGTSRSSSTPATNTTVRKTVRNIRSNSNTRSESNANNSSSESRGSSDASSGAQQRGGKR